MKQGTRVHKVLEEQVHQVVPVKIETKEDGWGLRIWNIIQGLRTLRATGMTRELEIWGVLEGQVVNGVIDEVSYTCPDPELQEALEKSKPSSTLSNQKTITELFGSQSNGSSWPSQPHPMRKVYLTDVKTRAARSLPKGASLRPMEMQLMLYHRLLSELATNTVDADVIFSRYELDAKAPFSETFIAEVASLEQGFISEDEDNMVLTPPVSELSQHRTLIQLWSLMITEYQLTIPSAEAMGMVLQAEFRSQKDGTIIGKKSFPYDDQVHQAYVADEMKWWKGEREAKGVEIEEAFKCGICEFAEGCEWRAKKLEESIEKFRERRKNIATGLGQEKDKGRKIMSK
jgi:exonuclease V